MIFPCLGGPMDGESVDQSQVKDDVLTKGIAMRIYTLGLKLAPGAPTVRFNHWIWCDEFPELVVIYHLDGNVLRHSRTCRA